LNYPVNAHLDPEYVPGERLRLDLYRRLADVAAQSDVDAIEAELIDRFGPLPEEAQSLLKVAALRAQAKALGVTEVVSTGKFLRISPLVFWLNHVSFASPACIQGRSIRAQQIAFWSQFAKPSGWSPSNPSPADGGYFSSGLGLHGP
jgi:transcription-repair coupling factor (superfamily II helicase)